MDNLDYHEMRRQNRHLKHALFVIIIGILALIAAFAAHADDLTWSWNAPTKRTDGAAFNMATEGAGYWLYLNGAKEPSMLLPGSTKLIKTVPASGSFCAEFSTQDVDGREGPKSTAVCKDVLAPPGAPTSVTVTITISP
jgi:hypothetical protein